MNLSLPGSASGKPHTAMITLAVMLGTFMQVLDTTIANVALPNMQGSLNATQDQIAWVLTSYIVGSAIMTPPTGWLAGRFGRKRVYLISMLGFMAASFLCGTATTLTEMVLLRTLQGLFGAAMVPISQAILLDTWPREKHTQAMAIFGVGVVLGPVIGPVLGAYLTEYYSWRWVFFINIPVGIVAVLMTLAYVRETAINKIRTFDAWGFLFMSVAIGALQLMLDRGERQDWFNAASTLIELALVLIGLWLFFVYTYRKKNSYIDLSLFKDRNFVLNNVLGFLLFLCMYAIMALIPPFVQNLLDYPVIIAGLVLMPRGVGTMISFVLVGKFSNKFSPRVVMLTGLVILAFSLYEMYHFNTQVDTWFITWTSFVQGIGIGLVMVPMFTAAFATLPAAQRTEGTGVFNLIRNIGGSFGISIAFTLLSRSTQISHQVLATHITPYSQALQLSPLSASMSLHNTRDLAMLNGVVTRQAAMIGFNNDFMLMMIVSLAAIPLVLLMRPPKPVPGGAPHHPVVAD
ncbi:MAG TPA: DHA2 family efflux MFS transporter permease subunit [Gammaproteobacteria bacterium]|nr:DHA2 family efflux MFS transporter permease subunit [Gammaproteobacteria bacterium]